MCLQTDSGCILKFILKVLVRFIPFTVGTTFKPVTCLIEVKVKCVCVCVRVRACVCACPVPEHLGVKIWLHEYISSALSRVE